jgi:2-iminobutanoate/2-iminopropanoate deaminase
MGARRKVSTRQAPAAIGPYSQAVAAGDFVFVSGQIPLHPETGAMVGEDASAQTEQVMKNVGAILGAAGCGFEQVVKATIYLSDMAHFQEVNAVYARSFQGDPPARATVEVARLPKDALVEIEVIALKRA